MSQYLKINSPGVVHEAVEGEVVIVNLDNGLYFSAEGTGAAVWCRIAAAESRDEIAAWAVEAFNLTADQVHADLEIFLGDLVAKELVTVADVAPAPEPIDDPPVLPAWSRPEINVYSDMEDLLLLDPVHDVADAGWPNVDS